MKRYSGVRLFLIVFTCAFLLGSMFVAFALQANAHFMRGANCHIEKVRNNGTVVLRLTNRTQYSATIECGLKTGPYPFRYWTVRRDVYARHYVRARVYLRGNWNWVRVVHAHIYYGDSPLALQANAKRVVTLTDGDDTYHANKSQMGAQTILALAGDDRVWGGVGADTEKGGPGDDRLHGIQPGADTLIGGGGWDICVVSSIGNDTTRGCEVVMAK